MGSVAIDDLRVEIPHDANLSNEFHEFYKEHYSRCCHDCGSCLGDTHGLMGTCDNVECMLCGSQFYGGCVNDSCKNSTDNDDQTRGVRFGYERGSDLWKAIRDFMLFETHHGRNKNQYEYLLSKIREQSQKVIHKFSATKGTLHLRDSKDKNIFKEAIKLRLGQLNQINPSFFIDDVYANLTLEGKGISGRLFISRDTTYEDLSAVHYNLHASPDWLGCNFDNNCLNGPQTDRVASDCGCYVGSNCWIESAASAVFIKEAESVDAVFKNIRKFDFLQWEYR